MGAVNAAAIDKIWEWFDTHSVEDRMEVVRMCKLDTTYDKKFKRITFVLRDDEWRRAIIGACVQTGMTRKQGKAPATFMERELQDYLEELMM